MALLLVLIGLVIISVFAMGMVMAAQTGARSAGAALVSSESRSFADAVLLQTAEALLDAHDPARPRVDGVPITLTVMGEPVTLRLTCETGKIDVNSADAATLEKLLLAAGDSPSEAHDEAGRIVVWRDGTGHHPFRVLGEVQLVPRMTPELYAALWPAMTIYSGRAQIDPDVAQALALQASSANAPTMPGEVIEGQLAPQVDITGWAFRIEAGFVVAGRYRRLDAVIRLTGDPLAPYFVLEETLSPV